MLDRDTLLPFDPLTVSHGPFPAPDLTRSKHEAHGAADPPVHRRGSHLGIRCSMIDLLF